jgi:hypothetical protein
MFKKKKIFFKLYKKILKPKIISKFIKFNILKDHLLEDIIMK